MVNLPDPKEEKIKTSEQTEAMFTDLYTDLCYQHKESEVVPKEVMERLRILAKRIEREQILQRELKNEH